MTESTHWNNQVDKSNEYNKRTGIEQHHRNTANTNNINLTIRKIIDETTPTATPKEKENNSVTKSAKYICKPTK